MTVVSEVNFNLSLSRQKNYDDNDKLIDVNTLEYSTELTFENGVQLKAEGGVKLEFIYQG